MTLIKTSVPKLRHPNYEEPDHAKTDNQVTESNTPTQTPWYHKKYNCSDDEEDHDGYRIQNESTDRTPSPKKSQLHDHQFDFASTPLNPNSTVSFISPMNKLNALHLESEIANSSDLEAAVHNNDSIGDVDDDDDDYDEFSLGNKTITNHSEDEEDEEEGDIIRLFTPQYISSRKRTHLESPDMMMLTPNQNSNNSASGTINKLSMYNTTSSSGFKFSFSNTSDSTPCPRQPKRKKLKFKHEQQQSQPHKNILDLNYAKKTVLSEPLSIPLYTEEPSDEIDDNSSKSGISSKLESTPISQSTPASLRASTPPPPPPPSQQPQQQLSTARNYPEHEEYGEPVNGYKFVKPKILPHFKYETPTHSNRYHQLRDTYNSNNYQIVGELPLTSAGMMDEDGDEDIHIGDKRINDPYLTVPSLKLSFNQVRELYFSELRLPLLPPYFYQLEELSIDEILLLISHENLLKFYESILLRHESLPELLKQERIKWHPDKWVNKLKQDAHEHPFRREVVEAISQTINGIIESL
ncbi:hypothetical protein Cantr_07997 [Candida viswanathii]|uniref:Uncharacterized protein n=1 Tax=Candida viswanathii TaxID=5486 RepID=A0A367Y7G6_9ASCO|nr:hypothetical protein Cantr_07997 [Candida viswanathii]